MAKDAGEVAMDKRLIEVYQKHGVKVFLDVCSKMLDIRDKEDGNKKKKANGEVCEVVLRVLTQHYLERKAIKGCTFQSLILNDLSNPKSEFLTELDFTLLTPQVCLSGECKSFVGDIVVTDECTLTRDKLTADVARQSKLHGKCLKQYLEKYTRPNAGVAAPPFGLFCFVYSNGTITDRRTTKAKTTIPVITIKSLYGYYDQVFAAYRKGVFDYEKAQTEFKKRTSSKALHEAHRKYLGY